jgi:hypothetical protein
MRHVISYDKAFSLKLTNKYKLHKIVSVCRDKKETSLTKVKFTVCGKDYFKVVAAYKRDKNLKAVFRPLGAIQYDQRIAKLGLMMK